MSSYFQEHWGDWASGIGLVITLVTFYIIRRNVLKAKHISTQVRKDISIHNSVIDFSSALSTMEDIKEFHRKNAWDILPAKYSVLRSTLITVRETNPSMSEENKKTIQDAITVLRNTEGMIEKILQNRTEPPDVPRLNRSISSHIDKLRPLLINLSNQIGR